MEGVVGTMSSRRLWDVEHLLRRLLLLLLVLVVCGSGTYIFSRIYMAIT